MGKRDLPAVCTTGIPSRQPRGACSRSLHNLRQTLLPRITVNRTSKTVKRIYGKRRHARSDLEQRLSTARHAPSWCTHRCSAPNSPYQSVRSGIFIKIFSIKQNIIQYICIWPIFCIHIQSEQIANPSGRSGSWVKNGWYWWATAWLA